MSKSIVRDTLILLIAFITSIIDLPAIAQTVKWSPQVTENSKFPFLKILGAGEDGFFVLRSNMSLDNNRDRSGFRSRKYVLQYFNSALSLSWEEELRASVEGNKVSGAEIVNDKLLVISYSSDKANKLYRFYGQFINSAGHYEKQPVLLDEFHAEDLDEDNKPGVVVSHDGSKLAFSLRKYIPGEDQQFFQASVFDSSLVMLYRKEIPVRHSVKRFTPLQALLSDQCNFFILGMAYRTDRKVKAPGESYFELVSYLHLTDQVSENEITIEEKFLTDVAMSADNQNRKIVVAGFFSDKTTYSAAGIFYYSLDEDSLHATRVTSAFFPASYLQKFLGERKENKNRELVNYSIDRLILRHDGGAVIVAESYFQTTRSYWDYYSQMLISRNYYHYGNIMVLSINPDGNILWNNVVTKDQNSIDDSGVFSSYVSAITGGKLTVIYNKYIEEDSVLSTTIDSQGNQKTDVLFNEIEKVSVLPHAAKQIDDETLLVPAYRQNKFFFLSLTF